MHHLLINKWLSHHQLRPVLQRLCQMDGKVEWQEHFNRWHFDMLVGPCPSGRDSYEWQVDDADLLEQLRRRVIRILSSEKKVGLDKVPTNTTDFNTLLDGEDWKQWWQQRDGGAGISLLPIGLLPRQLGILVPKNAGIRK